MKNYFKLFTFIYFINLLTIKASNDSILVNISGKIDNIESTKLYAAIEGLESRLILDSSAVTNGNFNFHIYTKSIPGFIYIIGNKDVFFDQLIIFLDGKDNQIHFNSNGHHFIDSLKFTNNLSNKLLYDFFRLNKEYAYKLNFLTQLNTEYPYKDDYYELNKKYFVNTLNSYKNKINRLVKKANKDLLSEYFLLQQDYLISFINKSNNYKENYNYIQRINSNIDLLNTDVLEPVFSRFITQIFNDSIPQIVMEKVLQDSFYSLLQFQNNKPQLIKKFGSYYKDLLIKLEYYNSLTDYLLKYGKINPDINSGYSVLKPGEMIKGVKGFSNNGIMININDFKSEYKLIYFWSQECVHCKNLIPKINDLYTKVQKSKIEFYSFSPLKLDSSNKNVFTWSKSASLLKGWENEFLIKYKINYTPLILFLNKENVIIDMPNDAEKLSMIFGKLGILKNE